MPFPSTRTIHPDWSRHHQPVADGTRAGRCTITATSPGGDGGWDPETGPTQPDTPTAPLWTGEFRAQALQTQVRQQDAAGQAVTIRAYLITITAAAPEAPVGARVRVEECPDNPAFVGKVLTITGVTYATHRFEWDLYADLDLTNQGA